MPPREHVLIVVKEWVDKAENDYRAAIHLRSMEDELAPYDVICFHAQQCIEKYLKAILVDHSLPVPKIHDIEEIIGLLPIPLPISLTITQMRWLTDFAVDSRYPGEYTTSKEDATQIMEITNNIRTVVRTILPAEIMREIRIWNHGTK